jgi:hypothetical protein
MDCPKNQWFNIKDYGPPPFDSLALIRGKDKTYNYWKYTIAYNEVYRPNICMTQRLELDEEHMEKLPVYMQVPFEIEEWMLLE